jgi:WD40 repeat protein
MRKFIQLICMTLVVVVNQQDVKSQEDESIAVREVARLDLGDILVTAAWSPNGERLVIGGENGLYLYDTSFKLIEHLQVEEKHPFVIDVAWSPDGNLLACIHIDGHAYLWDMEDVSIAAEWQPHTIKPTGISWSPDGSTIATSSWDGTVKLYDVSAQQQLGVLVDNSLGPIDAVRWYSDSQRLVFSTLANPTVVIWNLLTNQALHRLRSHQSYLLASLDSDGNLLAVGRFIADDDFPAQGVLYIWETQPDLKPLRTILLERSGALEFYALAWHPSSDLIAGYNSDELIRIWDVSSGNLVARIPGRERLSPTADLPSYSSLTWHCDGTKLVDVGSDGIAVIWEMGGKEAAQTHCRQN